MTSYLIQIQQIIKNEKFANRPSKTTKRKCKHIVANILQKNCDLN